MDKKQKQLFLILGSFLCVIIGGIIIYFASMFIACTFSTSPLFISLAIGGLIVIGALIVIYIYKRLIWLILLAILLGGLPTLAIGLQFSDRKFSNGYINTYYYITEIDEYGNASERGYGYDKFGRRVPVWRYIGPYSSR